MKPIQKDRITWVDTCKGICMLCVMLSHVDFVPTIYVDFFVNFFLSAFFLLSGYTYNNTRSFGDFIYRKIRTLAVPIFAFGFIDILLRFVFTLSEPIPLAIQIRGMFFQIRGNNDELWFLAAMFTTSICFYFIEKYIKNEIAFSAVLLLLFVLSSMYKGSPLPWHLQMIGSFCIWMGLGFLYKKHASNLCRINSKMILGGIIALYFGVIIIKKNVPISSTIVFDVINFIAALIGNMFVVMMAQILPQYKALRFIGQNTIVYFAFHGKVERVLMLLLPVLFQHFNIDFGGVYAYILSILCVAIESVVLVIPAKIVNRFFPFLLGHRKT